MSGAGCVGAGRLPRAAARGSRRPWRRRPGRAAPANSLRGRASGTRVGRPQREIMLCGGWTATARSAGRMAAKSLVGDCVTVLGTHRLGQRRHRSRHRRVRRGVDPPLVAGQRPRPATRARPAADHRRRAAAPTATAPGLGRPSSPASPPRPDCTITVCHLPPGTSKWNKIEHRLFSHITMNWRGRPLTSHEVIVQQHRRDHHPHRADACTPNSTPTPTPPASRSPTRRYLGAEGHGVAHVSRAQPRG